MKSIRGRLLGWLICGFAAASVVAGFGIFHSAREEAGELFDYELHAVARSMPANVATARESEQSGPGFAEIADDRILIEVWDLDGKLVYRSQETPALPRQPAGFRTIEQDEVHWRVFVLAQPERFVQVAQVLHPNRRSRGFISASPARLRPGGHTAVGSNFDLAELADTIKRVQRHFQRRTRLKGGGNQ